METLLISIEWLPVIVSTLLAFGLGWLWYSPLLFLKPWLKGIGEPVWQAPMWMPMIAQFGATIFLAIIINALHGGGNALLIVLILITLMGFIKSNGLYSGKTKTAISVELLYFPFMVLIMLLVNSLF